MDRPAAVATPHAPAEGRLESWKEIAVYLNRGVTTVQRWEREEGLPVHRQLHDALGSVYAYKHELEEWRARRATPAEGTEEPAKATGAATPRSATPKPVSPSRVSLIPFVLSALAVGAAAGA